MSGKPYDIQSTAIALGLSPEVVGVLIKKMASSAGNHILEIKKGITEKDKDGLMRAAHTLKGLALNFRFDGMSETTRALEAALKEEKEELYPVLLAGLEKELREINEVAARY